MLFDCSVETIFRAVGHDGSKVLWPELPEPQRRKAIHIEEIKYVAFSFGRVLADFVPGLLYSPSGDPSTADHIDLLPQLKGVMCNFDGILLGRFSGRGSHAVAWNAKEQVVYDPAGRLVNNLDAFEIDSFHAAIR